MARNYGNRQGTPNDPSSSSAAGSWISTTEVSRQKNLVKWPIVLPGAPPVPVGTYVYALSSGVSDTVVDSGEYLIANGAQVSRTTYPALYALCGSTYGNGDGSTTFNIPNANESHAYLKSTVTSGSALSTLQGSGVLPSHTHTITGIATTTSLSTNNNGPPRTPRNATGSPTRYTGFSGSPGGNESRRRENTVLIAAQDISQIVPGLIFPVSLPLNQVEFESIVPDSVLIASGQAISRALNPSLFQQVGTLYGSGDGSTTFNLPDLRGLFMKGISNPVNISGVLPSGYLVDVIARHHHAVGGSYLAPTSEAQGFGNQNVGQYLVAPATGGSSVGGNENRPANFSVVWCLTGG